MKAAHIAYMLSGLGFILSGSFGVPLVYSLYEGDNLHYVFAGPLAVMLAVSLLVRYLVQRPAELTIREGFLTVTLSWIMLSFFGSIPFFISGAIPDFTDAFFETMSGFTTTGASILRDIEVLPESLLLWRDMTQWLGGMGVIALAVAIFPYLGVGGFQLFKAEVPGPIKDKISPRISETARLLWFVYLIFTVLEVLLLLAAGMPFFDALCTALGTMATGGFSPRNASIAAYPSVFVQYTVIAFMFIAGVNFTLHYWALKGKPGYYWRNPEFRFFTGVVLFAFLFIVALRLVYGSTLTEDMVRSSLFQTVSIVTTTGFVTEDYEKWPLVAQMILLLLMMIGGCTSSTGGGMKNVRVQILFQYMASELKKIYHPHGVYPIKVGTRPVPELIVANVMAFAALYMLLFLLGVLILTGLGSDVDTAIGAIAATLGNVGPGIGGVGPMDNYATMPVLGKWVLSFFMMTGRLEIFTVLVLFTKNFWR